MKKYRPSLIEPKWQQKWKDEKLFTPELTKAKRPYYALMMFPYPSAEGLHVGNMYPFTAVDIIARAKRMQGNDVFEPIGLDAFGIHTENYAIKIGKHPIEVTHLAEKRFYDQLMSIGNSYDWTRTLETHKPDYYHWTQWVFLQLYKAGLAVRQEASVNWCPSCKTVLADEQVIAGACERCGTQVIQKLLKQWFFKITNYADRLLRNLHTDTWSDRIRLIQKNWIGQSEGSQINFPVEGSQDIITVYTVYPETIFGVTYMVITPEHPLVAKLTTKVNQDTVSKYSKDSQSKSDVERTSLDKNKTGVFTGSYVINPVNGQKIPVWVADYVIGSYGTGAVMGVPGSDHRDFQFAQKFKLPIIRVIGHGIDDIAPITSADQVLEEGVLVNSEQFTGLATPGDARPKIKDWLEEKGWGKRQTQYHLRDWLISRQRYWGPPIPIIYCQKCGVVPVPESDLPVLLPEVQDFKPTGTGKSPLASVPEFVNTTCPNCGGPAERETDVSDNFLDSAWYFFRYLSPKDNSQAFSRQLAAKWLPVDLYMGGFEHAILHLMYTRFITMVFKDLGLINFEEPFKRFVDNGHILSEGTKMSKSKGNVVNPDDYVKEYGADTLRIYLMFLGPISMGGDFRKDAIGGIYRFLNRIWDLIENIDRKQATPDEQVILNKTIKKVTDDIESAIHFNTAIAKMMELLNLLSSQGSADPETLKSFLKLLAPFAPHITEELWQELGEKKSIHLAAWPVADPQFLKEDIVTIGVQVNGKLRDSIQISPDASQEEAINKALTSLKVQKFVDNQPIKKTIYVPGKILSLVV